jgi:hypothetical protein
MDNQLKVLSLLRTTNFPKNSSRKNIGDEPKLCFCLGLVNMRHLSKTDPNYSDRQESRHNKKNKELLESLHELMASHDPEFKYTSIQVNKNVNSRPHVDKNNVGLSYIIALGDFTGGSLVIEGKPRNIKNDFYFFDGRLGHWSNPFEGERYSIVFFTHSFRPPCPSLHKIVVKKDGLYKKGIKIKSYEKK